MHIIQEEIGLPKVTQVPVKKGDNTHIVFSVGPLPPGFGMTLGNALRRVLLSSLPGTAISSVRVAGAHHEYTTLKGVRESVLDISLNMKQVKLRKHHKDPEVAVLEGKGPKTLKASDIKVSSDIEILNPDLELVHLEKGSSIKMELTIEKGVGYQPASERNKKRNEPGLVHIDTIFSPVERVRFEVESARVGERTNLDRLIMDVSTNGSLTADEAVRFSSQLLSHYFNFFSLDQETVEKEFMADFTRTSQVTPETDRQAVKESYTPIEILNLSPRTLNSLINAGVGSIEQLVKCNPATLSNFRGFGTKALDEVKQTLATRGLKLIEE
ncbi:DNA-directed RNA polymerase subunit alpha [Candidatus Peribacteria bacterium RIFCSPLOWO2_01_FULL_51_18]|nr:MAG: DNA-directed RNA polymerase subunit alpha [Candidatus Peribacteria bacterium RIFCSPHIGHO2_02_FULL_51_15]OGJ66377.1 MAG: DNA-directed RNA polymerase subunit alpha [Candidatus Peribacteria bacterium RIFCSPLOWO2_01_FULL_51_18]OGJ68756.1 MAG: DNA-directed RNA polymerase subunit alpha [Candidatus Peribacteria bacterium RIFCSPLOWO2_02_FULL_51_10]